MRVARRFSTIQSAVPLKAPKRVISEPLFMSARYGETEPGNTHDEEERGKQQEKAKPPSAD